MVSPPRRKKKCCVIRCCAPFKSSFFAYYIILSESFTVNFKINVMLNDCVEDTKYMSIAKFRHFEKKLREAIVPLLSSEFIHAKNCDQ